jgi:hypothetical protein
MDKTPAFPVAFKWGDELSQYNGMTLRDYFAAKAMQGLLASEVNAPTNTFAIRAYKVADAMMKARSE